MLLAGKGHIVSRSGRYACIYWPYHFMGVETPLTIDALVEGTSTFAEPRHHTVLAARAARALAAGETFEVRGRGELQLAVLVETQKSSRAREVALRLIATTRAVTRPLEVTGLIDLFTIADSTAR